MKKISCVFFVFILAITLILPAFGQNEAEFSVALNIAGDGVAITGYTGISTTIRIPATIQGMPVKEIATQAFRNFTPLGDGPAITSVTIPEGVVVIRNAAFQNCKSLRTITFPASLRIIESYAFNLCESLNTIEIPEGVSEIQSNAFVDCTSLKAVKLPKTLTMIKGGTFSGCRSLKNITIPEGITVIEGGFNGCRSLESVVLPSTISEIHGGSFMNCENLITVTIPDSVVTIEFTDGRGGVWRSKALNCFEGCKRLNIASQSALRKRGYEGVF
ncbi:hypothetical protein AGMMS49944_08770 [Spirochaetia bacterium]|nr:hypothetical protein AGMMS49944_08770 [Spirochaetia bacterium]